MPSKHQKLADLFGLGNLLGSLTDSTKDTPAKVVGLIVGAAVAARTGNPFAGYVMTDLTTSGAQKLIDNQVAARLSFLDDYHHANQFMDATANNPGTDKHNDDQYSPGDLTDRDNPDTWRSAPSNRDVESTPAPPSTRPIRYLTIYRIRAMIVTMMNPVRHCPPHPLAPLRYRCTYTVAVATMC